MASYPEKHYLQTETDADMTAVKERPRSCSTISSDLSSTPSLTSTPRPVSVDSSGSRSGSPSSRTLVQPRAWRIVPRSRLSRSQDRERAMQEDTSLEGDEDRRRGEYEGGSSVDGDLVIMRRRESGSRDRMEEEANGGGSSVDAVVRTKSDSDIAVQKVITNGDSPRLAVFKSRAERFSQKDDKAKAAPQKTPPMSRSQTLPLSLPPQLLAAVAGSPGCPASQRTTSAEKSKTLAPLASLSVHPAEAVPPSEQLPDKPKLVEVSKSEPCPEPTVTKPEERSLPLQDSTLAEENNNTADTGSDKTAKIDVFPAASDRPTTLWDSPGKSITLSTLDNSARVSFSKPADLAQPLTLEKVPSPEQSGISDLQGTPSPKSPDKPQVPAKPARRSSLNAATPASDSGLTSPVSPSRAAGTAQGPPKPPRTTLDQSRRSSSSLGSSPRTPVENVLFGMGFTIVDDEQKQPTSKQTQNGFLEGQSKPRPDVFEFPEKAEEKPKMEELQNIVTGVESKIKTETDFNDQDVFGEKTESGGDFQGLVQQEAGPRTDKEPQEHDIVAKKMTKIKGDKKAEEKANKAKKKEQKAKEKELKAKEKELKAKEKELKDKQKAAAKDETHHEKNRVKLFPWKVEFSAKDKGPSVEEASKTSRPTGNEGKDGLSDGPDGDAPRETARPAPSLESTTPAALVHPAAEVVVPEVDSPLSVEATPRKTDRGGDGAGSKSSSDRSSSQDPSPSTPSPQQDERGPRPQQGQDDQQPQQQEQIHQQPPASPSRTQDVPQRPPSSSPETVPEPHHPQPSPQLPRHEASSCSPPSHHSPLQHVDDGSSDLSSDVDSMSGSLRRKFVRQGRPLAVFMSESDGEATSPDADSQGRRLGPRRRTVGGAEVREQMEQRDDTDKKKEAFFELLATRYPQYADRITAGMAATHQPTTAAERNPRPREPQRRRTTVATYNTQSSRLLEHDDAGTMSDVEPSAFQRGGIARASLPIVRSASTSLERPIGLVFLVFGDETKKSLLPNEITSLDTVRALFVRAFPDKLSMEFLDSPKRKIYILEAATNIFFQLEDLRDIHDRTVLKIHECDSEEPQRVRSQPETRGRAVQQVPVASRPSSRQGYVSDSAAHYREEVAKAQSLPLVHNYQELMQKERAQWEMEQEYIQAQQRRSRSRSQTPELAERPRSLSTGAPRNRYSHSPDRMSTPERVPPQSLNPIPENPRLLANGFRQAALNGSHYEVLPGRSHPQHPGHPHPHPGPPGRVLSPPMVGQPIYESVYQAGGHHHPQSFVTHSTRAAPPQGPQRATGPPPPDMRGGNRNDPTSRHSLAFAAMSNPIYESFPQRTQSYRAASEREVMPPRPQSAAPHDTNRMERMEAQIAHLAAWVHHVHASPTEPARRGPGSSRSTSSSHSDGTDTYPGSSASKENGDGSVSASPGLSDIPASYSLRQPTVTMDMRDKMNDMHCRLKELRVELQGLKRMEQLHQEAMREAFSDTLLKIKKVMGTSGKTDAIYGRLQPPTCSVHAEAYLRDKAKVENDLRALEMRVDGLKDDVLTRRCHINLIDIEGQALQLSHISKLLADLKARCPQVQESLKNRSAGEAQDISEERFVSEEPSYIEAALKRCKTLTSTLATLKRIATAQDAAASAGPPVPADSKNGDEEEMMAILDNIRAMASDYDYDSTAHSEEAAALPKNVGHTSSRSETQGRQPSISSADSVDSQKGEPPQVPAKPARLLSASEIRQMGTTSLPVSSLSHTVTVTSQINTDHNDNTSPADRTSARSAFFSSMQSPPTSPASESETSKSSSRLPTTSKAVSSGPASSSSSVSSSESSSLTSPSHSKSVSGVYYQAMSPTRTRSAFSSIPLPNKPPSDKEDSSRTSDKGKKVPPPPPPRTSSAKQLYGTGSSPNANGGGVSSTGRRDSGDKSPDPRKKDSSLSVYKGNSPTSPGAVGPKPKPMNKFQKDIAAGIYANLNRPDLQHQKLAPDHLISTMTPPAPAAMVTNSQDLQEEADLSGSESTGSSTSLDSQKGAALLRANSSASCRGPRPNPPQRHSSLSARGSLSEESGSKTKTQLLQERVRKSQESGRKSSSGSAQVNGLDSGRNGHHT